MYNSISKVNLIGKEIKIYLIELIKNKKYEIDKVVELRG